MCRTVCWYGYTGQHSVCVCVCVVQYAWHCCTVTLASLRCNPALSKVSCARPSPGISALQREYHVPLGSPERNPTDHSPTVTLTSGQTICRRAHTHMRPHRHACSYARAQASTIIYTHTHTHVDIEYTRTSQSHTHVCADIKYTCTQHTQHRNTHLKSSIPGLSDLKGTGLLLFFHFFHLPINSWVSSARSKSARLSKLNE